MDIAKGPTGRIKGLRKMLSGLSKADVLQVIDSFDIQAAARYGFADSTDFDLVFAGRRYPPKAILGLAATRVLGRPLEAAEFSGGEGSACFAQLRELGFVIQPKLAVSHIPPHRLTLQRFERYDREAISQIFEPGVKFTRGAGRWGIQGIVETPKDSGNFVFLVTLGKPDESNPYQDALTLDGKLIWESQTQHDFDSTVIKKLLAHQPEVNNIHLFLRGAKNEPYLYLGLLHYFSHDPNQCNPVHFVWSVQHWELAPQYLQGIGIPLQPALDPVFSLPATPSSQSVILRKVDAPVRTPVASGDHAVEEASAAWTVDWAVRDQRNRQLGLLGEELVMRHEIAALQRAGRPDLAAQVRHVALTDSTAGYDIASFYEDGRKKYIEVKSTTGNASTPFYISANEVKASRQASSSYSIYRVFDLHPQACTASFFEIVGDVADAVTLEPISFRATFRGDVDAYTT